MSDISTVNLTDSQVAQVRIIDGDLVGRIPYSELAPAGEGVPIVADPAAAHGVRARYQTPKGGRCGIVGTSIDVGSGGDVANPNAIGRWSNGTWFTHLVMNSGGLLEPIKNGAVGGLTLGGLGRVMVDTPSGSDHLDIEMVRGPVLPFNTETLFVGQNGTGLVSEALYQTAYTDIPGGRRVQFLSGTTAVQHLAGEEVGWGMIGRFEGDWEGVELDIMFIGGPINNVNKPGWTSENIAIGQQVLAEMSLERGWTPVVNTITPAFVGGDRDAVDDANRAIRNSVRLHRHHWCEMFPANVDVATRGSLTSTSFDGLHPNQAGSARMAARQMSQVIDHMELRHEPRHQAMSDDDSLNALPSASFASGVSVDAWGDLPADWTRQTFFSSGITTSLVEPRLLDRQLGNLIRVTADNGKGTTGIKYAIPVGDWEPGDKIYLACFARLFGFKPDGFCAASVFLNVTGNLGAVTHACGPFGYIRDWEGGVFSAEHTIDTAVGSVITAMEFQIVLQCPPLAGVDVGFGNLEAGSPLVVNLTRQGIA